MIHTNYPNVIRNQNLSLRMMANKFLTSLFTQEFIPSRDRRKYFERIRTLLSQQYEAIEARKRKSFSLMGDKAASIVKKKLQLQMEKVDNLSTEVVRFNSRLNEQGINGEDRASTSR
ncbi:unnamed protein product [Rhizophagus irregularis]|nr:unnamed protein product [Rhizophagus irregularis]